MGRNQEALRLLNAAHRLFGRLDARVDLVDVSTKVLRLEETYFAVVRDWGQSIESSDSYTFGHCERVAGYAVALARELGLDEEQQTAIRIGAYLHDVGKVRVPHEILTKPGALTAEEFRVIQMHPIWGLELLATVEFPWDIKPIIRWHHEKYDGTGYPDRLRGDEIPVSAQIICIVDVYDALTTTRSYRAALSQAEALVKIQRILQLVAAGRVSGLPANPDRGCPRPPDPAFHLPRSDAPLHPAWSRVRSAGLDPRLQSNAGPAVTIAEPSWWPPPASPAAWCPRWYSRRSGATSAIRSSSGWRISGRRLALGSGCLPTAAG